MRLLLLTGCRPGEIRRLRWCEVKPDRLALIDAKTGPRHVLLGEAARELLDSLAKTASEEWVFPGKGGDEPLTGIVVDARLHDLRHNSGIRGTKSLLYANLRHQPGIKRIPGLWRLFLKRNKRPAHASHAVMNGESLHVAGRLLGHRRASTTNRYVHLDDATLSQAAERVAMAIQRKLCHTP